MTTHCHQRNFENIGFYNSIGPKKLRDLAYERGMAACNDLSIINNFIPINANILEIGGGYGRVLSYLKKERPDVSITAIEPSISMSKHLQAKFHHEYSIINQPLQTFLSTDLQFDVILWLWNGLADLPWDEQNYCLLHLRRLLKPNGFLIVDTYPENQLPPGTISAENKIYRLECFRATIDTYWTPDESLSEIAHIGNYRDLKQHHYYTGNAVRRKLTFFFN